MLKNLEQKYNFFFTRKMLLKEKESIIGITTKAQQENTTNASKDEPTNVKDQIVQEI